MNTETLHKILDGVKEMDGINEGAYVEFANSMKTYFENKEKNKKEVANVKEYDTKMTFHSQTMDLTIHLLRMTSYKGPVASEITYKLNDNPERTIKFHDFRDKISHYYTLVNPDDVTVEMDGFEVTNTLKEYCEGLYKINEDRKREDVDEDDEDEIGNYSMEYILGCMIGLITP